MEKCNVCVVPIQKGDKFSLKNELECKEMERIPQAIMVGSLMYA